ncbi:MAG: RNA methyltransferase [Caldilineaceae bacterium]|nr:RNA methyltransferase [Caldilineaceae bacterium]
MITSTSNSRIKEARKLQRRRQRYLAGELLLEGVRLIGDAWQAQVRPNVVFFAPDMIQGNPSANQLLLELGRADVETVACTEEVFVTLSETVSPQGIAAVVPLPQLAVPAEPSLTLVLDQVRDPGNAGSLLRSAAAAGVGLVIFGPGAVDPFNDKVVRAAMGAHFRVPLRSCANWLDVESQLGHQDRLFVALADATASYDSVDWREPASLVVGGEADGPSMVARQSARSISIPMMHGVESLNAAIAGSIILFEIARQRRAASTFRPKQEG